MRKKLLLRTLAAALGLCVCALSIYMTMQAGIGIAPWDALIKGISIHLGVSYGTISVAIGLCVLGVDLLMRERVGVGTLLDALMVGKVVDLLCLINPIPPATKLGWQLLLLVAAMFVLAIGQWLYMRVGLCCGPRDALTVGIGRRVRRVPIGAVNVAVLVTVLVCAWLLDGPVGLGTLISACGMGVTMQIVFHTVHFEPRDIQQESLVETCRYLFHPGAGGEAEQEPPQ